MTDVLLIHEADGGNVEVVGGRMTMTDGIETALELSLFGGNERDDGGAATEHLEWWFNKTVSDSSRKLRSRTQALLRSIPLVPANLPRIEDAAAADVAWFVEGNFATFVGVSASLPALNKVTIAVRIEVDGDRFDHEFTRNGQAAP